MYSSVGRLGTGDQNARGGADHKERCRLWGIGTDKSWLRTRATSQLGEYIPPLKNQQGIHGVSSLAHTAA